MRSKVMIEGTVFLHQNDHVFDVARQAGLDGCCASIRRTFGGISAAAAAILAALVGVGDVSD